MIQISVNGYLAFATVLDQGPTINVGPDATDWPKQQDPAMIAPYLCKQQIPQNGNPGMRSGVYYRLMMRQSLFGRGSNSNMNLGGTQMQSSFFQQSASLVCFILNYSIVLLRLVLVLPTRMSVVTRIPTIFWTK